MPTQILDISTSSILRVIAALLIVAFIFTIWEIIASVFLAIVIAAGVEPFVNTLSKFKIPRFLSAGLIYVTGFGILISVFFMVLPPLIEESKGLSSEFPVLYDNFVHRVENFLNISAEDESTKRQIGNILGEFQKTLSQNASNVFTFTFNIFGGIFSFLLILVISFYLVLQKNGVENFMRSIVPKEHQEYALNLWKRVEKRFSRWFQYQLLMGVSVGIVFFIVLSLMGVKYALTLALLGAVLEIIPMIGAIVAGLLSFTLVSFQSLILALGALVAYIVIQQLQQNLLMPSLMSKAVGLNPIVIIIILLVGAKLLGMWGVILAIPFAMAISEFAKDFKK